MAEIAKKLDSGRVLTGFSGSTLIAQKRPAENSPKSKDVFSHQAETAPASEYVAQFVPERISFLSRSDDQSATIPVTKQSALFTHPNAPVNLSISYDTQHMRQIADALALKKYEALKKQDDSKIKKDFIPGSVSFSFEKSGVSGDLQAKVTARGRRRLEPKQPGIELKFEADQTKSGAFDALGENHFMLVTHGFDSGLQPELNHNQMIQAEFAVHRLAEKLLPIFFQVQLFKGTYFNTEAGGAKEVNSGWGFFRQTKGGLARSLNLIEVKPDLEHLSKMEAFQVEAFLDLVADGDHTWEGKNILFLRDASTGVVHPALFDFNASLVVRSNFYQPLPGPETALESIFVSHLSQIRAEDAQEARRLNLTPRSGRLILERMVNTLQVSGPKRAELLQFVKSLPMSEASRKVLTGRLNAYLTWLDHAKDNKKLIKLANSPSLLAQEQLQRFIGKNKIDERDAARVSKRTLDILKQAALSLETKAELKKLIRDVNSFLRKIPGKQDFERLVSESPQAQHLR